jgi:hypothetical protein
MKIQLSSLDNLLKKRNLKYDWTSKFTNKQNLHVGKYSVYIILDSYTECKNIIQTPFGKVVTNYDIKYIGKGTWNDSFTSMRRKRCLNHYNDLYSDNLNLYNDRYLIFFPSTTLDETSAYMLEHALIDAVLNSNYTLTSRKARNIVTGKNQLWNKCKGHGNYIRTAA